MKVVATGRLVVYEPRGTYQIDVSSMRAVGVGELQQMFEALKEKLSKEGMFEADRKRKLPLYVDRIGLVTSPTGAAIRDFIHVLGRRFPIASVLLSPVRVQGPGAASDIADALSRLNTVGGIDVIVLARGGGSLEDLWPFNEETVARAISRSTVPVVSSPVAVRAVYS